MMFEEMEQAEQAATEILNLYLDSYKYLEHKIKKIYGKVKKNHNISDKKLLRLLERSDGKNIDKIIRTARNIGLNDVADYLESPDIHRKFHMLNDVRNEITGISAGLRKKENSVLGNVLVQIGEDTYYKTIFDIQQQTGFGFSFTKFDKELYNKVIRSKWSGENYSKRIWNRTQELAEKVKREMLIGFIAGKTQREMVQAILDEFSVSAFNARRLIRTESNFVCNEMHMQSYRECGIEKYRFVATLDLRTSETCAALDGKVFHVKDAIPGVNMPPMHPWCRSTTIMAASEVELSELKRRARNPDTGKNEVVSASMTYQEWNKKYVKNTTVNDRLGIISNNNKSSKRYYDYKNKSLQAVEKEISELAYEVSVGYNKNGKAIFCQIQKGNEHEIKYTQYQLRKMRNMDITHNHIYGTPPSPEDLYLLVENRCSSVRACSNRGTYILKTGDYVNNLPEFAVFDKEYSDLINEKFEYYYEMVKNGIMSKFDAEIKLQENVWHTLKEKYNIDLSFEVKKND